MGIEPTQPAWKAGALPLSYTRVQIQIPAAIRSGPRRRNPAAREAGNSRNVRSAMLVLR